MSKRSDATICGLTARVEDLEYQLLCTKNSRDNYCKLWESGIAAGKQRLEERVRAALTKARDVAQDVERREKTRFLRELANSSRVQFQNMSELARRALQGNYEAMEEWAPAEEAWGYLRSPLERPVRGRTYRLLMSRVGERRMKYKGDRDGT